ncbi:hypothetical protein ACH42_02980 [Endozoicomonas sp. (ex Bugula neritina AB1)]|nr:hypothetical protein ACH42_02980 [Endozoicomonas sp. (ex Bugula neritina AB1)]
MIKLFLDEDIAQKTVNIALLPELKAHIGGRATQKLLPRAVNTPTFKGNEYNIHLDMTTALVIW